MADKDDDASRSLSVSASESEEDSDNETNGQIIPSLQPLHSHMNTGDIDLFLEQVATSSSTTITTTTETSHSNLDDKVQEGCSNPEVKAKNKKERDLKRARRMLMAPECKCHLNGGQPCHTRFSVAEMMDTRMHYLGLSRKELDIAVLAKLECGIHLTKMTTRKKRKPTERKKHRTDFYHRGYRICNLVFVYLHGFSYKKLKALILQYKAHGVKTRVHKNLKPKPPDCEAEPKVKKKKKAKAKPQTKPQQPKTKKCRLKRPKEDKASSTISSIKQDIVPHYQSISLPPQELQQPLQPTPQPVNPPPQRHSHPYPVSFPISTQPHSAQATAFTPAPHNPSSAAFAPAMGYAANGTVFANHQMTGHLAQTLPTHPGPPPPAAAVVTNHNPTIDYPSQCVVVNPPLDFSSNQKTNVNINNMQGFQAAGRPCVTYSVVHSVTF